MKSENETNSGAESGSSPSACCALDRTPVTNNARRVCLDEALPKYVVSVEVAEKLERQKNALLAELISIANASMSKWEMNSDEFPSEFQAWAQNRARHAIDKHNA